MSNFEEEQIRLVFAEMTKYKPSLAKFTIFEEDEDEVDCRLLGDQVIKNFPCSIDVELRRGSSALADK